MLENPVIVALDTDDVVQAKKLFDQLKGKVGGFKIGPRLTFRIGSAFLRDLSQAGTFFLDHKFFDIPSTTVASVRAAYDLGAHWVTVHALNGGPCLKDLSILEKELRLTRPGFRILAVTVLTSFTEASLPPIWKVQNIQSSVRDLARLAYDAGLRSFVSSAEELSVLKAEFPDGFFVVPGIRLEKGKVQDQARVATPSEAITQGASALVIGRPILEAKDPVSVVREVVSQL